MGTLSGRCFLERNQDSFRPAGYYGQMPPANRVPRLLPSRGTAGLLSYSAVSHTEPIVRVPQQSKRIEDGQELRVLWMCRLWLADQLLKKGPVVNHGLAQVFGASLSPRLTKRALVGCPVIFENQWMAHRDIGLTLFKVAYRIATRGHHIAQQLVGVCYCATWAVNEPRLDSAPGLDKPRTIARSERPDVQALHSFCALVEHRLCLPPAPAFFFQGAGIFRATKLSA